MPRHDRGSPGPHHQVGAEVNDPPRTPAEVKASRVQQGRDHDNHQQDDGAPQVRGQGGRSGWVSMDSTDRLNDKVEHAQCAECERDQRHRWLEAAGADGRRLDDPGDFVRLEIEAALTRGVRVIPVLVEVC